MPYSLANRAPDDDTVTRLGLEAAAILFGHAHGYASGNNIVPVFPQALEEAERAKLIPKDGTLDDLVQATQEELDAHQEHAPTATALVAAARSAETPGATQTLRVTGLEAEHYPLPNAVATARQEISRLLAAGQQ